MFFTTRLKLKVESVAEPMSNVSFAISGIGPLKFVQVVPGLCLFRLRKLLLLRFRFAGLGAPAAVAGESDMSKKSDGVNVCLRHFFRVGSKPVLVR